MADFWMASARFTALDDYNVQFTKVACLHDYQLRLEFDDGTVREVDLTRELHGEVFEPLKSLDLFNQVHAYSDTNTIEWPSGADFAPEFLPRISKKVKKERVETTRKNS